MSSERGIALPVALAVLLVVSLLVAVASQLALATKGLANRDANAKAALAAADAGLRVANYRISMLMPDDANCVTTQVVAPVSGACPQDGPESLGNGATFSFWTTPVNGFSSCAGLSLVNQNGVAQRCVVSIGTVNGVARRTEARVAAWSAIPLFPVAGMIGLKSVTIANNAQVNGYAGSNGTVTLNNNAATTGVVLGPSASLTSGTNARPGTVTKRTPAQGPFVLSPVDPGNSATVNDNGRIANGLLTPPTTPSDTSVGVSYVGATRSLTLANNASLTLGGGTYNFCSLTATNNVTIALAPGVRTRIFIDSPDRPGSGCPAGSGSLSIKNNSTVVNPSADPLALQIYVYGSNDGSNVVDFNNNSNTFATLYAPQSTVNLLNNGAWTGAVSANAVNWLNNATFNWDTSAGTLQARPLGLYFRTAWVECPPAPAVSSDPFSGC